MRTYATDAKNVAKNVAEQMNKIPFFSLEGFKKQPAVIPIVIFTGIGVLLATLYGTRCLIQHPDVKWFDRDRKTEDQFRHRQYKFFTFADYSKYRNPAPDFEDE